MMILFVYMLCWCMILCYMNPIGLSCVCVIMVLTVLMLMEIESEDNDDFGDIEVMVVVEVNVMIGVVLVNIEIDVCGGRRGACGNDTHDDNPNAKYPRYEIIIKTTC
eukprot:508792_1